MALPSAILEIAAGCFIGLDGFLRYAGSVAEGANRLTDEIGLAMGLSALSLFTFALLTPTGLLASYLFVTGSVRALFGATSSIPGDPILALADRILLERGQRTAATRAAATREAREGPAVPDLVETGAEAGLSEADWVVTSSRVKPGWDKGVFVITPERWYRIADATDRPTPEGLRRIYVLQAVGQAEVIRRSVCYEHPRLVGEPREGETARSVADMTKG